MRNRLPELLPDNAVIHTDIVIEPSLAGAAKGSLERIGFTDKQLLIVCDTNTHAALGARFADELSAFAPGLLTLKGKVHADEAALEKIRSHSFDALIAVGSGVISDLCKYASHAAGKPYAVFPTAPSMNGYLSASASMTLNKVKESRPAHLPAGVFCDMKVIAGAPARLIRSGLGDSLCRPTAQADWLLSHLLLGTSYSALPFHLLWPYETELFAHADKLVAGDVKVVELLLKTLLVSGLGMTLAGGSYPASQGEHLIAHAMEMKHGDTLPQSYHGEQIGVTTLTMARIQHALLSRRLSLPPLPRWQDALSGYFGASRAKHLAQAAGKKYRLYDRYEAIAAMLDGRELYIRDTLRQVMLPETRLREVLHKAGTPATPAALGWNDGNYDDAVRHARFTRDRFTFLDLL
jgi:glycerol-1-phosphate dehydrogenase [NAD(P)+]